ncbi:MAG TPA: four-carbon acid sugar kinase family protein, partial [Pirellulaceae bacterium]|nr:four-carbon acid sugar kinase family protein [Pirellulaceae bacterium]
MTAGTVDWYALADDFSGAAEIAGIAVAHGVAVEVRTLSGDEVQLAFDPPLAAQTLPPVARSACSPLPSPLRPTSTPSPNPPPAGPRLVVIDTATRSLSGDEAQRIVGLCARRLAQLGRPWFKKIDSVLRGRVLAEARAVAAAGARVIIAPANPSRGRTIASGIYYVGGRPLDATLFASDPEHP